MKYLKFSVSKLTSQPFTSACMLAEDMKLRSKTMAKCFISPDRERILSLMFALVLPAKSHQGSHGVIPQNVVQRVNLPHN